MKTSTKIGGGSAAVELEEGHGLLQLLGLAADPCVEYDVVLTLTGAADAAGTVAGFVKILRDQTALQAMDQAVAQAILSKKAPGCR